MSSDFRSPPPLVHVAGDCAAALVAELRRREFEAEVFDAAHPADVDFLLAHGLNEETASPLGSLRLLQLRGVGVDHIPLDMLPALTHVATMRGVFANLVAEYAWSAVLALWRNWPVLWERFHARDARRFSSESLEGRTMLVLGAGEIGRRVLSTARSFAMRTIGVVRVPRSLAGCDQVVSLEGPDGVAELDAALELADVVVVAAPLTSATRGLLSGARLGRLKRTALLVAVSRGGIIDEDALATLLRAGQLGGAILDVCDIEPVDPTSVLYETPNLFLTPHLAGFTRNEPVASLDRFIENIARLGRGEVLLGEVDRRRGY